MYNDVIKYTKEFDVDSSVVDEAFFNENDNTAVLDINDTLYRYSGVTQADLAELVSADSVGAYYNTKFKKKFGPGDKLGVYGELDYELVSAYKDQSVPTTPKGLTLVSEAYDTKEFSLDSEPKPVFDRSVSGSPVSYVGDVATKEFSLSTIYTGPSAEDVDTDNFLDGVSEVVVHFTLDAYGSHKFKFVATSDDVAEAIAELHDYVSKIELTGRVTKVVTKF